MTKLNPLKIRAYIEEFPFLKMLRKDVFNDRIPQDSFWSFCDSITIKRVTNELLEVVPRRYPDCFVNASTPLMINGEEYYLFDKERFMGKVKSEYDDGMLGEPDTPSDQYGERVIDCIARKLLETDATIVAHHINYIVSIKSGYVNPNIDDADNYFKVTIYKTSKDENLADIILQRLEEARKVVRAESNF